MSRPRAAYPLLSRPQQGRIVGPLTQTALRVAAACAAIVLVLASGPVSRTAASGAPASSAAAVSNQTLLTIACPGVSVCYVGGENGTLLATRDGGATWEAQAWLSQYRQNATSIVSIACPSMDNCFAQIQVGCDELGARVPVLRTSDGGRHWTTTTVGGCGTSLACPGLTTCYTSFSPTGPGLPEFVQTTNSGASWQVQARINPNRLEEHLACPAPGVCYVGFQNAVGRSTDAGKHWSISRLGGSRCAPLRPDCPEFNAIACPGRTTCYAGGGVAQNGKVVTGVLATRDGFRTRKVQPIGGLDGVTALSCPAASACVALLGNESGHFALTGDGGTHWRVGRISPPYPFTALSCPAANVCYVTGYLGRVMGTRDGGATWRDLTPAIFLSGTYSSSQPAHTYSPLFSAAGPWDLAVGKVGGPVGANGRPVKAACRGVDTVSVYVRDAQNQVVAGPFQASGRMDRVGRWTVRATGKLRLDAVSRCSTFSVRADGVTR